MYIHRENGKTLYISETLTLSDNASAVALPSNLIGGNLFSVEIKASADDSVVFTINSRLGTVLFTKTTSTAVTGVIESPLGYWALNKVGTAGPTYTLSGLGSGTVQIEITVFKQ
jgi:hypothetical protein